jgi:hypothetical protein
MILRNLYRVIGLQNCDLFRLPKIFRWRLAGQSFVEPPHLPLARSCLFVGEMRDWRWSIGSFLFSRPIFEGTVLSIVGLNIVYAVFMGFSFEGATVVELAFLVEGCHWCAVSFGSFDGLFMWSFLPRLPKLIRQLSDSRCITFLFFKQH